jgi:hypothetical protein
MPKYKKLLVAKANGDMRIASDTSRTRSAIKEDEVAWPLIVDMPAQWGKLHAEEEIRINMPPPPTVLKQRKRT